jgi:hypothetical protein
MTIETVRELMNRNPPSPTDGCSVARPVTG